MNKRFMVVGSPGAGKSVLSRHLEEKTKLPLLYLDCLYWLPNWVGRENQEFDQKLIEFMTNNESWIIDGNFKRTLELRASYATDLIFLDIDTQTCLKSAIERSGTKREDLPDYLEEKMSDEFIEFIKDFSNDCIPLILSLKEKYPNLCFHHFKTREEAHKFVDNL